MPPEPELVHRQRASSAVAVLYESILTASLDICMAPLAALLCIIGLSSAFFLTSLGAFYFPYELWNGHWHSLMYTDSIKGRQ
jgi:hypothetical protein